MAVTPNSIVTPQKINTGNGVLTTANTTYTDTPTNSVLIFTAGADGSRITRITSLPRGTCTATNIDLYRSSDLAGTIKRFIDRKTQAAQTIDATTACPKNDFGYNESSPILLEANETLWASMTVTLAAGMVINVEGSDY